MLGYVWLVRKFITWRVNEWQHIQRAIELLKLVETLIQLPATDFYCIDLQTWKTHRMAAPSTENGSFFVDVAKMDAFVQRFCFHVSRVFFAWKDAGGFILYISPSRLTAPRLVCHRLHLLRQRACAFGAHLLFVRKVGLYRSQPYFPVCDIVWIPNRSPTSLESLNPPTPLYVASIALV